MSDRLRLPKLEPPVEPADLVRARARGRVRLVAVVLGSLLAAVGARGVQLCVLPSHRTVRAASVQRWDQVTLRARRGEVLDRDGRRLATSVATPNIVVDPVRVDPGEVDDLAAQLAEILEIPVDEVSDKMRRASRYQRLASKVHPGIASKIERLGHPALWTERSGRRYYPEERLASQVLGFVDASGTGRQGLEAALDAYLRGGSLVLSRRRDRHGLNVDDPTGGRDLNVGMNVHLSLDRTIQRAAERALAGIEERSAPVAASAVVIEVATGDILAMANTPTYNPNELSDSAAPRRNHTIQDAVEAGSVFKPFTVAAAVQQGLVSSESAIDCENGSWHVGRTRIRDDHPHGVVTVSEVIKYSSNIGSAKLALQLGPERLLHSLRAFGFGERSGVSLPGERAGMLRRPDRIKPIELATTSYGQGVTSTPLQLAMATAALANDGVRMRPRLVTRVEDHHGVPELVRKPIAAQRVVAAEVAREVAQMMVTVTEPGGTATRARVPGYRVAGKTGTAEKVKDGRYSAARIGSFIGFVPADDPVIAIVVVVDEPTVGSRYGGVVAGPAFAEIAGASLRHLGVPPDPMLLPDDADDIGLSEGLEPEVATKSHISWTSDGWALPDLTGWSVRQVVASLEATGVAVELAGSGAVVSQEPQPGTPIRPGAAVSVVLQ